MRRSLVLAALLVAGATAGAQAPNSGQAFAVTPYAGYMIFGDYLKGPLGTSLTNAPAMIYGAQASMKLNPTLSLVGNVGYSSTSIRVGLPIIGGYDVGSSAVLVYDGGVQLDMPASSYGAMPIRPFLQVGAGAIRYRVNESVLSTEATNLAGNVGVGADVALSPTMGMRVMAKDYIGKFDFKEATHLDVSGQTAHNWALSAGLRLSF